jgi:hypothetical protein
MVTIVDCVKRTNNEGSDFIALIVQSDLEIVTSRNGNVYCAVRKSSIPSTLENLEIARMMIGKELPGTIEKKKCMPFETVNNDGEIIHLDTRWEYVPEEQRTVVEEKLVITMEELEAETV